MTIVATALAVCAERLGTDASGVLARLGGSLGEDARRALTRGNLGVGATHARAPVPAGIRLVHPTWIEAALEEVPERTRSAIANPVDAIDVWLARTATASMPPMPVTPVGDLERIVVREASDVVAWLAAIGADQLAYALGPAAGRHPRLAAAAARIGSPPRSGALGTQRAAIGRCKGVSLDDDLALVIVGSRALASRLHLEPLLRLQLVHRLPRAVGLVVEREIAATAPIASDAAPTLAALVAS